MSVCKEFTLFLLFVACVLKCSAIPQEDVFRKILCLPGIKTFSTSDRHTYYECKYSEYAVLKRCPQHTIYWAAKEICFNETIEERSTKRSSTPSTSTDQKPKVENQKILGQIVSLGDLYNAKNNQFLPGTSLWSGKTLDENRRRQDHSYTFTKFFAGKTSFEKLEKMDISAELKLSFLGGLISVSGSASYFREENVLETEETFTLAFQSTTHADVLPKNTPKDYKEECDNKEATHVVSSVTYGQNGYFFFKNKVSKSSERQDVAGSLQIIVKNIPSFSIEGKAEIKLNGEEKKVADSTEVQFYGDFVLENTPTTYKEAVAAFKKLPALLGKPPNYVNAKPVSVQLTPLYKYCDKSDNILIGIGISILNAVTKTLEKLEDLGVKVNTLSASTPAILYGPVQQNLNIFKTYMVNYQTEFKGKLQKLLPSIRGKSGKSETDLTELLISYELSPLNYGKSSAFLTNRNREIRAIDFLLDRFDVLEQKNFQLADYETANDVYILLKNRNVVTFDVNILQPKEVTERFIKGERIDESNFWFNIPASVGIVGRQVTLFKKFVEANTDTASAAYLVRINRRDNTPVTIYARRDGRRMANPFVIPEQPVKPVLVSRNHNSFTIAVINPSNIWVTKFFVTYWTYVDGVENAKRSKDFDFSLTDVSITNLQSATVYLYRVTHYTDFGLSPPSDISEMVMTTPCSRPLNLMFNDISEKSMKVTWNPPFEIGEGVVIDYYKATISAHDQNIMTQKIINKKLYVVFNNLKPITKYVVNVVAITPPTTMITSKGNVTVKYESLPITAITHTSPRSPSSLNLVAANLYSVNFTWSKPSIALGAIITEYLIKYKVVSDDGSTTIIGTDKMQSALTNTNILINGLAQGTTYGFSVQIRTSLGKSEFSKLLIAKTKYSKTQLEKFRDSIRDNILAPQLESLEVRMINKLKNTNSTLETIIGTNGLIDRKIKDMRINLDKKITKAQSTSANLVMFAHGTLFQNYIKVCNWAGGQSTGKYKHIGIKIDHADCLKSCILLSNQSPTLKINGATFFLHFFAKRQCFCNMKQKKLSGSLFSKSCIFKT